MATASETGNLSRLQVPDSMVQVTKLARYQLREYLRSMRFVALVVLVAVIGVIVTALVAHFRGGLVSSNLAFYGSFFGGGGGFVIVLAAIFFGGDAIAGEFQNKTGYFLMGLPLKRTTIYVGKFIAAYLASVAILLIFLAILVANGAFYFGAGLLPWQLAVSLVLALVYLGAVLGSTFLFSSLFKVSAYGFVLTAILFLIGFGILQDLIVDLVKIEPWMVISYASSTIGSIFSTSVNWGLSGTSAVVPTGFRSSMTVWTPGIAEGVVIMLAYLVITAVTGLWWFRREEFT
jgi:ABC-2 type transport system permease protein